MNKKKKFVFYLIYIILILFVFEVFARIIFSDPTRARKLWVNESISWRRSWVERHKSSGKAIYFKFDIYDPTKGWKTIPNIRDMEVFEDKFLNTNSIGLRGIKEFRVEKDSTLKRIFVIGDSYTFGEEVSDNENFPNYLQQLLPKTEVMNLGVHGYGHDQMLISLQELGPVYKPDYVILGFIEPDMKRNLVNFRDYAKPKFKVVKNKLKLTSVPVPTINSTLRWDWLRPRLVDVIAIIRHQIRVKSGDYESDKIRIATAILTEIVNESRKLGATPIFVYIPLRSDLQSNEIMVPGEVFLNDFCNDNNNVRYFSSRPYLINKGKKGTVYKDQEHWGPEGNLAIAEAIKQYMRENGLY